MYCMGESYKYDFMALLGGPVRSNRPTQSANVSLMNPPFRAYAQVRGLNDLYCSRKKVRTLHMAQFGSLTYLRLKVSGVRGLGEKS